MAAPIDWSDDATTLCIDADLQEFETDVLQWTSGHAVVSKWRKKAKDLIGEQLDLRLRDIEVATDAADVKDLIGNIGVLKPPACYLTLHLLAMDVSHGAGDLYDRKAEVYFGKYQKAIEDAIAMLSLDLDEDGVIQDVEKYAAPTGVTLKHGG